MGEQIKLQGEAGVLTAALADANRWIATQRAKLRAHNRTLAIRRSRRAPAAEIVALKMQGQQMAGLITQAEVAKVDVEARLAVIRPSDGQDRA